MTEQLNHHKKIHRGCGKKRGRVYIYRERERGSSINLDGFSKTFISLVIVRESKLLISKCSFYPSILYYFLMEKGKAKKRKKIKTNNASKELSKHQRPQLELLHG